MKHYTSIEQSKNLLELGLSIKTADMAYLKYADSDNPTPRFDGCAPMILMDVPIDEINCETLPCWSLGALSEMLPEDITDSEDNYPLVISKSNRGWSVSYSTPYYRNYGVYEECGETLIEAVYGMIVWLIENDYIKKGE